MHFKGRVRELGRIECQDLKEAVLSIEKAVWSKNTHRQTVYANVHSQTQSIVMVFCEGWPDIKISKIQSGWNAIGAYALPLMQEIIGAHYPPGGQILRAMAAKLTAGGVIGQHKDAHASFSIAHRIHVPLVTNDNVKFEIAGKTMSFKEGMGYEINNRIDHAVYNNSNEDRIHFIFDYMPPPSEAKTQK